MKARRVKSQTKLIDCINTDLLAWASRKDSFSPYCYEPRKQHSGSCIQKFLYNFFVNKNGIRGPDHAGSSLSTLFGHWCDHAAISGSSDDSFAKIFQTGWASEIGLCYNCRTDSSFRTHMLDIGSVIMREFEKIDGLCLDCVKNDGAETGRPCRLQH